MTTRPRVRSRYCATYVPLPFGLSPTVSEFGQIVVPPLAELGDSGRPPVTIRFHRRKRAALPVDLSAVNVALLASRRPAPALRSIDSQIQDLTVRAANRGPDLLGVAELITRSPRRPVTQAISTELFEYCLRALNRFLDVYVVATEDPAVHRLVPEHVGPEVVIATRPTRLGKNTRLLLPNATAELRRAQRDHPDRMLRILPRLLAAEPQRHPIDQVRQLKVRADRLADTGEHDAAVVVLQSSAERLVHALHFLARVDQGLARKDAEVMVAKPFKRVLISLGEQLGGNWSITNQGPVAVYWRDLYQLRGRILHAGHLPSRDAIANAFAAYDGLWRFALAKTLERRKLLPRTALALHGGVGLREANALDAHMRAHLERIRANGEEYNFWLPFDERAT